MEHEVTESQKKPPKGLLKPQTNLDDIALSAVNVKALIIPVGNTKSPLIQRWQEPGAGSYNKGQLERWRARYNNPRWGIPCGPGSETTPGNMILVTDVDFQKDKDKKPIGLPILGPVPYKLLEQAGFSQPTASLYQGKRTYQFFWPWEDRFKILSNSRLTGTTIDIRTARGQVVLYRPLPPLDIWNNLNSMPDDLFEIIKTLSKESSADDWEDGNRNNTLFKKIALDIERNQGGKVPEIIAKAKAVGLPDREVNQTAKSAVKTAVQGDHGIDPGPSLNEATAPVASQKQVKKNIITWVTCPEILPPPPWLLPDFIPLSAISAWAGLTGKGRTTTLLNLLTLNAIGAKLPGTDQKGDKRPFLYHGPENPLSIIQKRVKDAGGNLKSSIQYLQHTYKGQKMPPMQIPKGFLLQELIKAIQKQIFSAVVCDTIYLLFKDQNSGASDILLPIALACMESKTAFIGVCHLKKNIVDQEVIHHIRGDSDIVTYARSVVYMREGKEKNQRVIVPLKNSFTGEVDSGFVTTMPDNDSPLTFHHHLDNNFKILKEYGKPFSSFTDSPSDKEGDELVSDMLAVYNTYGDGNWRTKDFETWINSHTKRKWDQKKRQRILIKAGLINKFNGREFCVFARKKNQKGG